MNALTPLFVLLPVFGGAILFVKVLTDFFLKKKMINQGLIGEDANKILFPYNGTNKHSSLKWGLIVLFAGIGLTIIQFLPYDEDYPLPYGIFLISVAVGFLIYYAIVSRKTEEK